MFVLTVILFGLTFWLGCYLTQRDVDSPLLRWAGVALVFYATALGLLAVQQSRWAWLLLMLGAAMWVVDLTLAQRGVLVVGEAFWPDALRSLEEAAVATALFGLPVGLTIGLATGATPAMRLLLLVMLALAIGTRVFAEPLQRALDRLAFRMRPRLQQARAALRGVAEASPRVNEEIKPARLDEAEFVRLTRRALRHYNDLPRLSANPLTRLTVIDCRLAARQATDNTLERAGELQALLREAIQQLKPPGEDDFGATDGWRYYNALYFPYVAGLKPYSRRNDRLEFAELDDASQQAYDWLRTQVPERTLYNWQNAAAKLVAQYLLEQE